MGVAHHTISKWWGNKASIHDGCTIPWSPVLAARIPLEVLVRLRMVEAVLALREKLGWLLRTTKTRFELRASIAVETSKVLLLAVTLFVIREFGGLRGLRCLAGRRLGGWRQRFSQRWRMSHGRNQSMSRCQGLILTLALLAVALLLRTRPGTGKSDLGVDRNPFVGDRFDKFLQWFRCVFMFQFDLIWSWPLVLVHRNTMRAHGGSPYRFRGHRSRSQRLFWFFLSRLFGWNRGGFRVVWQSLHFRVIYFQRSHLRHRRGCL